MHEITDSLARAFDRIGDFEAVQAGVTPDELLAAVNRLQESIGIDDRARAMIGERLDGIRGSSKAPGHVLLGLILGLITAELDAEARSRQRAPTTT